MRWFILINAENNWYFDLNGSIARLVAIFFCFPGFQACLWHMCDLIYFVTCGFWTDRKVWNELPLNSSSSRGPYKQQSIFVRLSFCHCYFRDKVINCEVCVHIKHVCKWVYLAGSMKKGVSSKNLNKLVNLKNACKDIQYCWSDPFLLLFVCIGNHMIPSAIWNK